VRIIMEKVEYKGWSNCVRISNQEVELLVTADVGPRIIRFGFIGAENEFMEFPDQVGKTGGSQYRFYGGHRLWHAPEDLTRTYVPDNGAVAVQDLENGGVRFTQEIEGATGIQKELDVFMAAEQNEVTVIHRMYNRGLWPVPLAPWALTQMASGGTGIFPLPPRGSHTENLLPTCRMALWSYTDMRDPRWTWGERFILLRQDPLQSHPQKFGLLIEDGWMAYARNEHLFVKFLTPPVCDGVYPDLGVNVESFTDGVNLELESLGPVHQAAPGESVEHVERWLLAKGIGPVQTEEDVLRYVLPLIGRE
jgi:hypothetical protein